MFVSVSEMLAEYRRQHLEGMAELKSQLDAKIRAEAQSPNPTRPEPFGLTLEDIEQERARLKAEAEARTRRGWGHVMEADAELGEEADSVAVHDQFTAEMSALQTEALRGLDQLAALVGAFNDARLDVYNALRREDRNAAVRIADEFVQQPAIVS